MYVCEIHGHLNQSGVKNAGKLWLVIVKIKRVHDSKI